MFFLLKLFFIQAFLVLFWKHHHEYRPAQASPPSSSEPCLDSEEAGEEKHGSAVSEKSRDRESGVDISSTEGMHVSTEESLGVCSKGRRQDENNHGLSSKLNDHRGFDPRKGTNLQVGQSAL